MSKELVIGSNRHETKVAILEEDQLVEVYFQRANEYSLAGSIHKGRVTRVLPGMQSAFVDLGLERDTFLYVSDFFEENDDIDTVTEDKPVQVQPVQRSGSERGSGERGGRGRDRGGDRGQDRNPARRNQQAEERVAAEPQMAAPPAAPDLDDSEDTFEDTPAESAAPVTGVRAGEQQPRNQERSAAPQDRNDADRGGRNDRRGRRSRRRRRGRDFPENKYAQPTGLASGQPFVETPRPNVPEFRISEVTEEAEDVIILPGESLAKYRNKPAAQEVPRAQAQEEETAHEETATEAEELELTDKIFAHRDDESIQAEEEKIVEVEQDHPAHEASDLDAREPQSNVISISQGASSQGASVVEPSETINLHYSPEHAAFEPQSELAEFEADDVDLSEAEEVLPETEDLAPEIEEALENAAGDPNLPLEEPGATSQPQTAVLRDQGGRSMHRMSRRMRRRRGGNRPSQQNDAPAGGNGGPVAAAGAAPAAEPEARTESHRENVEERSVEKLERVLPSISELLKPGQEIIVQIAKEPLGQKGARITSHIALPGRYVVFMPSVVHLGVSRKVASEEERLRLKRILQTHRAGATGGFIVRTAGEGVPEEEIAADMNFLYSLWLDIRQKAEKRPAPALLHYDLDIVQRILRDQVTDEFKSIWVDNEDLYESVVTFIQRFQPALVNRVKMYTRSAPIFDAFSITQELEKALRPKVWLKSGGYIVINQTEALVAIDINTGKYVGKSNRLEDTIVKTNIEAVKEIVRQIRLRDLGGIIVVDFIDMDERKNRQKVMQALEEAMRADKAPYKILQFNDFGLVAITRKRVKQSLERTLCAPCPYCEGAGYVKSVQTVIGEILAEAQKLAKAMDGKDAVLRVNPDVAKVLKARDNRFLEEIEEILKRPVLVKGDETIHHEKFDLA